jgi:hypothetical protein
VLVTIIVRHAAYTLGKLAGQSARALKLMPLARALRDPALQAAFSYCNVCSQINQIGNMDQSGTAALVHAIWAMHEAEPALVRDLATAVQGSAPEDQLHKALVVAAAAPLQWGPVALPLVQGMVDTCCQVLYCDRVVC